MGVIKRGIIGGFSGRVGSIVGSSWKGIAVVKSLPLSVANPKTAAQTTQRTAFKETASFASKILSSYIKPLWDRFASKESGFNAFLKKNVPLYVPTANAMYNGFVAAVGKIEAEDYQVTAPGNGDTDFILDWEDAAAYSNQEGSDLAYAIGYDYEKEQFITFGTHPTRDIDTVAGAIEAGTVESGDHYVIWLAFKRADGTAVSTSVTKTGVIA